MLVKRNEPASAPEAQSASGGELSSDKPEQKAFSQRTVLGRSWDFEWAKSLDAFNEWVAWEWIAGVVFVVTLIASYFLNRDRYALKGSLEESLEGSEQAWWDGERKIRPHEAEDKVKSIERSMGVRIYACATNLTRSFDRIFRLHRWIHHGPI